MSLDAFETHVKRTSSPATARQYVRTIRSALRLKNPLDILRKKNVVDSTRQAYRAALVRWAQFNHDKEMIETLNSYDLQQELKQMKRRKASKRKVVRPFATDELAAILGVINEWEDDADVPEWVAPSLRILITLGLRAGVDLACIERQAIVNALDDPEQELVIITKGATERVLPAALVLDDLHALLAIDDTWSVLGDLIAPNAAIETQQDSSYKVVARLLKSAAEEAGLDPATVHTHRFRHTAANDLYDKTEDILLARDFLGHKSTRTTERYLGARRTKQLVSALKKDESE